MHIRRETSDFHREHFLPGKPYKIMVVSDSHDDNSVLRRTLGLELPFDLLIHCGDSECNLLELLGKGRDYDLITVRGNCDSDSRLPMEYTARIAGHTFWITHGNQYGVKITTNRIAEAARERGADVCLFGHTHSAYYAREGGLILLNPGALMFSRMDGGVRTYAVIDIDAQGKVKVRIRNVPSYFKSDWT